MTKPFTTTVFEPVLGQENFGVVYPQGFGMKNPAESDHEFFELCSAIRLVDETVESNQELAEAMTVLLNRAYAIGAKQAAK